VSAAIKIQDAHYTRRLCRCRRGHGKPASGVTKQHNMVGIDPGLLPQRSNCRHDILGGNAGGGKVVAGFRQILGISTVRTAETAAYDCNRRIAPLDESNRRGVEGDRRSPIAW
jgi:hypothetical protein